MTVKEYGDSAHKTILLLHGGGLGWWNFRREAELLAENYHLVLPILDGHAGSDRPFTSIEENARALIAYIRQAPWGESGRVWAIGGLSLGAQVLVEMLAQKGDICRHALIESALVLPMPATHALIGSSVSMSYGLIAQPWFARLQFKSLGIPGEFYEDYYRDSCGITKADMIAFLQANTAYRLKDGLKNTTARATILVGGKEQKIMRDSAALLNRSLPGSTLTVLAGYTHGQFSLGHPADYARLVETMANDRPRP